MQISLAPVFITRQLGFRGSMVTRRKNRIRTVNYSKYNSSSVANVVFLLYLGNIFLCQAAQVHPPPLSTFSVAATQSVKVRQYLQQSEKPQPLLHQMEAWINLRPFEWQLQVSRPGLRLLWRRPALSETCDWTHWHRVPCCPQHWSVCCNIYYSRW